MTRYDNPTTTTSPATPAAPAGPREHWTAQASWYVRDTTEHTWRPTGTSKLVALSRQELNVVARHLTDLHQHEEQFELLLEHHQVGRPAYRINDIQLTRPEDAPARLADARAALKRGAA